MGKSNNGKELGVGISQRKDGRYEARFINHAGKRESVYGKTPAKVRQALFEAKVADDKKSKFVHRDMTMDDWFDIWLDVYKRNCRNTTITHYKNWYSYVKDSIGKKKVCEITPHQLQIEINDLVSNHCRRKVKYTLTNLFKYAMQDGIVDTNPATYINANIDNEFKKERETLDDEQVFLLLDFAKMCRADWVYPLINVALYTGMRIGEIFALTWNDVDFNNKKISVTKTMVYINDGNGYRKEVHPTKTGNGNRTIPIVEQLQTVLKEYRETRFCNNDELIFKSHGIPLCDSNMVYYLKRIERDINERYPDAHFPHITPHCLRHTFATKCILSGMLPKTLQIILGHSNINITLNLYCHVKDATKFDEMEKVFGAF